MICNKININLFVRIHNARVYRDEKHSIYYVQVMVARRGSSGVGLLGFKPWLSHLFVL
jgi:hypothetical protein